MRTFISKFLCLLVFTSFSYFASAQQDTLNALSFDGVNDYVALGNNLGIRPSNVLMIEAWVYSSNWSTAKGNIISNKNTRGYSIGISNGTIIDSVYRGGFKTISSPSALSGSGWHHIAMVSSNTSLSIYIDGSSVSNLTFTSASLLYDASPTTCIGSNYNGTWGWCNVTIDELRIWNTTTPPSSTSMYNEVASQLITPKAYYRFNHGIAGQNNSALKLLYDYSTNGVNGTLINFNLNGSNSNWVIGKTMNPFGTSVISSFTNQLTDRFTVNWTRPGLKKGGNGVKVFVKQTNSTTETQLPDSGTNYAASSVFGTADQIGTSGWHCVYDGSGTSVTVTGLNPGTSYRTEIYEYQRIGSSIRYNTLVNITNNPANTNTDNNTPVSQISNLNLTSRTTSSLTVGWDPAPGTNSILFINSNTSSSALPQDLTSYTANPAFGQGSQIGSTGWYCVYKGGSNSITINDLVSGVAYKTMAFSFNYNTSSPTFDRYNTSETSANSRIFYTQSSTPSNQSTNLDYLNLSGRSITTTWVKGNGQSRIVFARYSDGTTALDVQNDHTYIPDTTFGLGEATFNGWYCIYNGTDTIVNISGLEPYSMYTFIVCEYNGSIGNENYTTVTGSNILDIQAMYLTPTIQSASITFPVINQNDMSISWTRGDGALNAVFLKETNSSIELAAPFLETHYAPNSVFESGDQIDGSGWYCVYNGSGSSVAVTNLKTFTTYRAMVVEYNGEPNYEQYLLDAGTNNPLNQTTLDIIPSTQSSTIQFTTPAYPLSASEVNVSWTSGNGDNRVVFMRAASSGNPTLTDYDEYPANASFGTTGTELGASGWFCVYNGSGNNIDVTNLTPNTSYIVQVFDYYGTPTISRRYNMTTATANPNIHLTDYLAPTNQASNINASNILTTSFDITWDKASTSTSTVVFVAPASETNPVPANNSTYTVGNTYFTNWSCVYNGSGSSTTITGLTPGNTYKVIAFAYNGTTGKEKYNTSLPAPAGNPLDGTTTIGATTWNGTIWTYGVPNATLNAVIAANYNGTDDFVVKDLTVNNDITFNIAAGHWVTVNGTLTNNGNIYLKSPNSLNPSGSLITNGNIVSSTPDSVYAERYITSGTAAAKNYHYIGSPIAESFNVEKTFPHDYVQRYNNPTKTYVNLLAGNQWNPKVGYQVLTTSGSGRLAVFRGLSFNTGNQVFNLTRTLLTSNPNTYSSYNLISNPYPSAIDLKSAGITYNNVYDYYWIWNSATGSFTTHDGYYEPNIIIPAMQGFLVYANVDGASLTMTNAARLHSTSTPVLKGHNTNDIARLSVSGNGYSDDLLLYRATGENKGYKLLTFLEDVPQVYAINNSDELALLKVSENISDTVIQLGFTCSSNGNFAFSLSDLNLKEGKSVYILDMKTNEFRELKLGDVYNFDYSTSDSKTRFKLLIGESYISGISASAKTESKAAIIWAQDNIINVKLTATGKSLVKVFNTQGVEIKSRLVYNSEFINFELSSPGVYIVNVVNSANTISKKVFVK